MDIYLLEHIEVLDLSNNNLTTLPSSIGDMRNLRKLILRNNKLNTLPATISACKNLQEIDITGNPITFYLMK